MQQPGRSGWTCPVHCYRVQLLSAGRGGAGQHCHSAALPASLAAPAPAVPAVRTGWQQQQEGEDEEVGLSLGHQQQQVQQAQGLSREGPGCQWAAQTDVQTCVCACNGYTNRHAWKTAVDAGAQALPSQNTPQPAGGMLVRGV
jgi:hypothetical protein